MVRRRGRGVIFATAFGDRADQWLFRGQTAGIPYRLKAPFDFSFLKKYGTVFKALDNQDSGNICFGVRDGEKRCFIKYAGAPTVRARVNQKNAIDNLKPTETVYRDLAHPNLVKIICAEEIGGGFARVFEWADAECLHVMYPLSRQSDPRRSVGTTAVDQTADNRMERSLMKNR